MSGRIRKLEAENEKLQEELSSILAKIADDERQIKEMINPIHGVLNDLVSVQPMTAPVGKVFSMKYIKKEKDESK